MRDIPNESISRVLRPGQTVLFLSMDYKFLYAFEIYENPRVNTHLVHGLEPICVLRRARSVR